MGNSKLDKNIFKKFNSVMERLDSLEKRLDRLEEKLNYGLDIQSSNLMRVKNGEKLSDEYILKRLPYNDLSPEKAYKLYQEKDSDFVLLDVSCKEFIAQINFPEAIRIPLDELNVRYSELPNKHTPILVISEDGTRSIKACELLNSLGYYNINNVSGGIKFWPENRLKNVNKKIA